MKHKIVCASCGESDPDLVEDHCSDHEYAIYFCTGCQCPQCAENDEVFADHTMGGGDI